MTTAEPPPEPQPEPLPEPQQEPPPELSLPPRWQEPAAPAIPAARRSPSPATLVLAAILLVIIVGVVSSPFWASAVAALLPWGGAAPVARSDTSGLHEVQARLDAAEATLEQQAARLRQVDADAKALREQIAKAPAPAKSGGLTEPQLMRLDGDEQIIRDMADRIAAVEKRPVPPKNPPPPVESPQTAAAIKSLQDQIGKLGASTASAGDRVAKLQTEFATADASARANQALLLALANLRVKVEGTAPFATELTAAQTLASTKGTLKSQLATLDDSAKTGIPSRAALTERFDRTVAPAILRARRDVHDEGWWQQIRARVERLVVIRRIAANGTMPRDPTEAAVARADTALHAGDLAGAVAALAPLSGDAAKAAAPWLTQAKRRLAAETMLAKLWQETVAQSGTPSRAKP